ncbi:MAG: ABC transporter substrate-binding protein [Chloroflexi bacterium]|nr:MAG: ABC transporter substrate-binding protein [Chloroflexota bacterium]
MRKGQTRWILPFTLVLLTALLLAACGPKATPTPPPTQPAEEQKPAPTQPPAAEEDRTLVIARNLDDLITLDPGQAYEHTNLLVHRATYETLVEFSADDLGTPKPRLAERWEVSDDGLTYTFYLRSDAVFASGNPVTAQDVVFSWNRLKNLKGNPAFYADPIASVEAVDDHTVKVVLSEPATAFLSILAAPAMSVLDSQVVKEQGGTDAEDADKTDQAKDWLDQHSAGSGPYVLTRWEPKAEVVLEANPNYYGPKPYFRRVILKHVSDAATQLQLVQKGDVDVVMDLDRDLADQVQQDPNLQLVEGQTLNIVYLALSPDEELGGPLADVRVRQAIAYAIDYEGLIEGLLRGYAAHPPTVIPLGVPGVDAAKAPQRDLEKAKELLAQAGAENLKLSLAFPTGLVQGVQGETLAAKVQADLAEAGIQVDLQPMERSVFYTDFRAQKLPFLISVWTPDYVDVTMWTDYFAQEGRGVANRIKYASAKATEIAKAIAVEQDPAKRQAMTAQLVDQLLEEMPYVMLFQPQSLNVVRAGIQGYQFHPVYFLDVAALSR